MKTNVKNLLKKMLIGGDPEIFIATDTGEVKSSIPILKRDKNEPIILDENLGIKLYADNSLAEFAFNPAKSKNELVETYRKALQETQKHLGKGYRILVKSAHYFKENELEKMYDIDPMAVGCQPELNWRKREINQLGAFTNTMRSSSAHIHVSHPELESLENKETALNLIEAIVGMASVLWDNDETSVVRRSKYGTSGSCRFSGHDHIEARFMSSYMLNSPKLVELTYELTEYALSHILDSTAGNVIEKFNQDDVVEAINTCNKKLALKVLKAIGLPKDLFNRVIEESEKTYTPNDLYTNWQIEV